MIPSGRGRSAWWDARAAAVVAFFPLAGTDWEQHADLVEAGVYSVQNRSYAAAPATALMQFFADEPPLTPEEEEAAAASAGGPAQMELF